MPTRYHLGLQAVATADAAGIIGALNTLLAVATDVNTAAAVSQLTWTRDNTAGSEAIYSSAFGPRNCRIIIAVHDSGTPSPSPTMVGSADTYAAANVLVGLADNAAGAYAGWNQAAPFSGCTFAGYYRLAVSAGAVSWRAMVSTKDLVLQYVNGAGVQSVHVGAVVAAPTSPSGLAESDGYRYGMLVSGVGDMVSVWRSNVATTAGYWGKNGASNGNPHFGLYAVGGTSWQTCTVKHIHMQAATADSSKWDNTTPAKGGIAIQRASAPLYDVGTWAGIYDSPTGLTGQAVADSGGTQKAVRWSSSIVTTSEESVFVARSF